MSAPPADLKQRSRLRDFVGSKYGSRTVLSVHHEYIGRCKRTYASCRCDCGAVKDVLLSHLRSGKQGRCIKCASVEVGRHRAANPFKYGIENIVGKQFGSWTVLGQCWAYADKQRTTSWRCRCACGSEGIVKNSALVGGRSTRCRKCAASSCGHEARARRLQARGRVEIELNKCRMQAIKRSIEFDIDHALLLDLFNSQGGRCALTGIRLRLKEYQTDCANASIDRINSAAGYVRGNVQWVTKEINLMKNAATQEYFILMCRFVAMHSAEEFLDDGSATVVPPLYDPRHPRAGEWPSDGASASVVQSRLTALLRPRTSAVSRRFSERVELSAEGSQRRQ